MRILLIGANGQLGTDLAVALASAHEVIGSTRAMLDVCAPAQAREVIAVQQPDLVLNTTAYNKVDLAEKDAAEALQVNAYAAQQLGLICRDLNRPLMHISTDFVFDGTKAAPYTEADLPHPLSAYGTSKYAGERLIQAAWPRHYIIRTCGLYGMAGSSGKGGNFVNTMLKLGREGKPLKVVADQICTPTSTHDLAAQITDLIAHTQGNGDYGLYHINNHGQCSWHEFAAEIFKLANIAVDLTPIRSADYAAPATRPPYSVLQNTHLQTLHLDHMRDWREALAEYIDQKLRD